MHVNVNYRQVVESIDISLTLDELSWLVGVIGAQTGQEAVDLYNNLVRTASEITGIDEARFIRENNIALNANRMAKGQRYEKVEFIPQSFATFFYDGIMRRVDDPVIEGNLLRGTERYRGTEETNQFKSYYVDKCFDLKVMENDL